jgi:hypothetical protein
MIKNNDKKTLIFITDDIRLHSGIGTVSREIILNTADTYNYIVIGAAINHPEQGKVFDLSDSINTEAGITGSSVYLHAVNSYEQPTLIRQLVNSFKIDGIVFITDPRYYVWLFHMENELRRKLPFIYINIWDSVPYPIYNTSFYNSCDLLLAISKQTKNINKVLIGAGNYIDLDHTTPTEKTTKKLVKYLPHGIDENKFFDIPNKLENQEFLQTAKSIIPNYTGNEFIVFWNNRNIRRKNPADIILGFRTFVDQLSKEKQKSVYLVMHTQPIDDNGTDLIKCIKDLTDSKIHNIIFSPGPIDYRKLNYLYNMSDCVISATDNEGWGLSITEAMMSGRMVIPTVTGGHIDQMRFEDENGKWIDYNEDFGSNHNSKYKKCGTWVEPMFIKARPLQGSIPTPYISCDKIDFEDIALSLARVYSLGKTEIYNRGKEARKWVTSDESKMTTKNMSKTFVDSIETLLNVWTPTPRYHLIKSTDTHKPIQNPLPLTEQFKTNIEKYIK